MNLPNISLMFYEVSLYMKNLIIINIVLNNICREIFAIMPRLKKKTWFLNDKIEKEKENILYDHYILHNSVFKEIKIYNINKLILYKSINNHKNNVMIIKDFLYKKDKLRNVKK